MNEKTRETETTEAASDESQDRHEVRFSYVKSYHFRVIHADGAWGGISPRGDIHIAFYNERAAIPDESMVVVNSDGAVIKPEEYKATSELVREVEADVIVDLGTAIQLRSWLDHKIKAIQGMAEQAKKGTI